MIVEMRHLDLVCMASEKDATLARLASLGAVHLDFSTVSGESVAIAKGVAADAEKAVRLILKSRGKTPVDQVSLREHDVGYVLDIAEDLETLKQAEEELEHTIREYEPYGDFDPVLAAKLLDSVEDLRKVVAIPEKLPPVRH